MLDLPSTIDVFRYMGGWCSKLGGRTLPVSFDGKEYHAYTRHEPLGVVGAITPWNYPLALGAWKIASALAAGCTVVLKPTELTPLSTMRLAELCLEAGLPEGALNIVNGYGHEAGAALSPACRRGQGHLHRLDRGRKEDCRVFPRKPETGHASNWAASHRALFSTTQISTRSDWARRWPSSSTLGRSASQRRACSFRTASDDKVVEAVAGAASQFKVGNGQAPDTMMGPLVSAKQQSRVLDYIASGREQGADLVYGGKKVGDKGYFVEPTIFANANPSMKIVKEEIFGPVVSVMRFKDIEEVTRLANDTTYGLAAKYLDP
ncbi:aldehyde dehydrogenase family protein [Cupriavidus basilensis]